MSEDGEKDQEEKDDTSSPSASASARRKKRSSGQAAKASGGSDSSDSAKRVPQGKASAGGKKAVPQGKNSGARTAKTEGKSGPTPKRDGKSRERESLFAKLVRFLREVWGELKKVVWPTRKQMGTYTVVVFVFLAFMIALVFGLDYVFQEGVTLVFGN